MKVQEATGTWLWVTQPRYYLDDEGKEREDLDPKVTEDFEGWWTCHKDTKRGDLILLWRTMPKCDIGHLILAETDAFSIVDDPDAAKNWDYACEYRVLHRFKNPVTKKDLDQIPAFQEWKPYRGRFQHKAFQIDDAYWQRLMDLLVKKNPEFRTVLAEYDSSAILTPVRLEEEMEAELARDLGRLKKHGYDLELVQRQLVCREAEGRIDLLCRDRKSHQFVVIELKRIRAGRDTYAQITSYMSWVRDHRSNGKPVLGLVISRGADNKFLSCKSYDGNVGQLDLQDIGFE